MSERLARATGANRGKGGNPSSCHVLTCVNVDVRQRHQLGTREGPARKGPYSAPWLTRAARLGQQVLQNKVPVGMASDDDVENSLLDEAYHDITEAWTTENGAPVLVSVDVTATRGVAGEVELEYDWSVSDWKAAEQSNFGYGFNALAIITEPSLWLVLDVGPSAKADWANVVRAVNGDDPELVTGGVNAPGGRMQVHIDLRGYGPIEDVRLNGSVPKPFVTADGKPLDIVVIHKDGFALLPPSSYDLDGVKQKFSFTGDENAHVSVTVVLLDDADKIQALLAKLATTHLPPSLQQLSESAKKRLLDSDSDAEDAEDWPAKRTRFAGQAAVAAPPVVVASQRWKDTTIDLYPGHMDKLPSL